MIEFVVASHGNFAREAVNSGAMICGSIPANIHILSIEEDGEGICRFEEEAGQLAKRLEGSPVLILSDLYGGSPFMALLSQFRDNEYKLISGFNLPMIIEMFQSGELELAEAAQAIVNVGKNVSIKLLDKLQ